jgi:diguanylate cyclase (GGDEF)-like protein/PAS domain S-box-containing protein
VFDDDDATTGNDAADAPPPSDVCYRRLFETAKDGILIVNGDTRKIMDANPSLVELLGYRRNVLIGQEFCEIGLLNAKGCQQTFGELMEKGYLCFENLRLQTKRGEAREVEFVSSVYVENGCQIIQCNVRDITERRRVERHLRKINDELTASIVELNRRDAEMSRLDRMHRALHACATLDEVCKVTAAVGGELFSGKPGSLAILHGPSGNLEQVASWGVHPTVRSGFSFEDCWALKRGELHDARDSQTRPCRHFVLESSRNLCVPLTVSGETLGVLSFFDTTAWTGEDRHGTMRLIMAAAEAIKMSLSKLMLQERLREQAIRDPLTGLFNRRFLEETIAGEVYRAQRRHSRICVGMLDLDHFKRFNDDFGHEAGDAVLRELARVMRRILRKSDIICRYGGDEFVLVFFDSRVADARKRVEQVCAIVKEMQGSPLDPRLGPITVSAGLAQAGGEASGSSELLSLADKALYAAKAAGGDRVLIHAENESSFKPDNATDADGGTEDQTHCQDDLLTLPRRPAIRPSADAQPASKGRPVSSISSTSGA